MLGRTEFKGGADNDWTPLKEIAQYFEREPNLDTLEAERFDALATPLEAYEAKHRPIEAPDPVAAIIDAMERRNFNQADPGRLLGPRSRASEILARKRPLTTKQAWALHEQWHVPAESLLRPGAGG